MYASSPDLPDSEKYTSLAGSPSRPAPDPARTTPALAEGGNAGDGPAHDQDVHFVGALVGAYALEVVGVPHRRVVHGDAVAAEDGPGLAGDGERGPDVVELAE